MTRSRDDTNQSGVARHGWIGCERVKQSKAKIGFADRTRATESQTMGDSKVEVVT
jgi:hypothetical protein